MCKHQVESDVSSLSSTHEEADTRTIFHAAEAFQQGFEITVIVFRDADVLLVLVHKVQLSHNVQHYSTYQHFMQSVDVTISQF